MSFISIPLILQFYCLYHAYRYQKAFHWYLLIIFIPIAGSILYLILQVLKKRNIQEVQESVTEIVLPSKKINELEQRLQFSDTYENKIQLADAFFDLEQFTQAIPHYESALKGLFTKDIYVHKQLVKAYYYQGNFAEATRKGKVIKDQPDFKKSDAYFVYAMALAQNNEKTEAQLVFHYINKPYSNYAMRLHYAEYLINTSEKEEAKEILEELITEEAGVNKLSKQENSSIFKQANELIRTL